MDWESNCARYLAVRGTAEFDATMQVLVPPLRQAMAHLSADDIRWLAGAVADDKRKWFVAYILRLAPSIPEDLFAPLIRAAVHEINPSFNRSFVEPCLTAFGHRRVNETLLAIIETGTGHEKAGAVNALYWAQMPLRFRGAAPDFTKNNAPAESRAAYEALEDVWLRKRCLFLQEFVRNPHVDVRRSLIPGLVLDPAVYPDHLKPLVGEAIRIARTHADEYIRHRVEVQLGNERLLKPLPHRA